MADNTTLPSGSGGDSIRDKDRSGIKTQIVGLDLGIGTGTESLMSGSIPVTDNGTTLSVDDGAGSLTVDSADLAAIKAAVEILDNIVAGSEAQVDVLTLPALSAGTNNIGDVDVLTLPADPLGANADAAATAGSTGSLSAKLRLATSQLDSIKTATETIDNAIAGSEMQVDVVGALPAGANAIGKLAANSGVDIGDVDVLSLPALPAGSNNIGQVDPRGNVAHDGADSGNPIKTGGRARTVIPAAVAQDDRVDAIFDKHGRQLTARAPIDQRTNGKATYTNTTAADVIAAPGASIAIVVTSILVVNGHATVGTKVEVRDGTTVKLQGYAAALGGGFALHDADGLFVATANTAATARAVTTGADVDVFLAGFTIPA